MLNKLTHSTIKIMKKICTTFLIIILTLTIGASLTFIKIVDVGANVQNSKAVPSSEVAPKSAAPVALVYRGPASCPGCSEAAADMLKTSKHRFTIRYIGPDETTKFTPTAFQNVTMYVQPGGDTSVAKANKLLGGTAKKLIKQFVKQGGKYLGICQGAYLAGTNPGMRLLGKADTAQFIKSKNASIKSTKDTIVAVKWLKKTRKVFFQDGPYFKTSKNKHEKVLARYENNLPAALVTRYGKGSVAVIGPHPEAPASWYNAIGVKS